MQSTIVESVDTLIGLSSSKPQIEYALTKLELLVGNTIVDDKRRELLIELQNESSLTGYLLQFLAMRLYSGALQDLSQHKLLTRVLNLIQGLLLMHPPSRKAFGHQASIEYLLRIIKNASTISLELVLAAFDALLYSVVDMPANMRNFEKAGGLPIVVGVLKSGQIDLSVRIKVIELLYYYLLPEQTDGRHASHKTSSSAASTPGEPEAGPGMSPNHAAKRRRHKRSESEFTHPSTPKKTKPISRRSRHLNFEAVVENGFVPQTPVKPQFERAVRSMAPPPQPVSAQGFGGNRTASGGSSSQTSESDSIFGTPLTEYLKTPPTPQHAFEKNAQNPMSDAEFELYNERMAKFFASQTNSPVLPTNIKRERLRQVMPNVEVLENHFKALSIGQNSSKPYTKQHRRAAVSSHHRRSASQPFGLGIDV